MSTALKYSVDAFKKLSGVLCVYKPKGVSQERFINDVGNRIVSLLNKMPHSPTRHVVTVETIGQNDQMLIEGGAVDQSEGEKSLKLRRLYRPREETSMDGSGGQLSLPKETRIDRFVVEVRRDLSESKLVLGDRYIRRDLHLLNLHDLGDFSSGVSVFAIGEQSRFYADSLLKLALPRTYHIKGQLGRATHDFTCDSHTMIRTSWRHVSHAKMDRVLTAIQRQSEKALHTIIGIDPHSQKAYELLSSGSALRMPEITNLSGNGEGNRGVRGRLDRVGTAHAHTVFYKLRCIAFAPPDFALEMVAGGESCTSILAMVDNLGSRLGSSAHCTQLRRSKYGSCTTDHCLLMSDFDSIDRVLENISSSTSLFEVERSRIRMPSRIAG